MAATQATKKSSWAEVASRGLQKQQRKLVKQSSSTDEHETSPEKVTMPVIKPYTVGPENCRSQGLMVTLGKCSLKNRSSSLESDHNEENKINHTLSDEDTLDNVEKESHNDVPQQYDNFQSQITDMFNMFQESHKLSYTQPQFPGLGKENTIENSSDFGNKWSELKGNEKKIILLPDGSLYFGVDLSDESDQPNGSSSEDVQVEDKEEEEEEEEAEEIEASCVNNTYTGTESLVKRISSDSQPSQPVTNKHDSKLNVHNCTEKSKSDEKPNYSSKSDHDSKPMIDSSIIEQSAKYETICGDTVNIAQEYELSEVGEDIKDESNVVNSSNVNSCQSFEEGQKKDTQFNIKCSLLDQCDDEDVEPTDEINVDTMWGIDRSLVDLPTCVFDIKVIPEQWLSSDLQDWMPASHDPNHNTNTNKPVMLQDETKPDKVKEFYNEIKSIYCNIDKIENKREVKEKENRSIDNISNKLDLQETMKDKTQNDVDLVTNIDDLEQNFSAVTKDYVYENTPVHSPGSTDASNRSSPPSDCVTSSDSEGESCKKQSCPAELDHLDPDGTSVSATWGSRCPSPDPNDNDFQFSFQDTTIGEITVAKGNDNNVVDSNFQEQIISSEEDAHSSDCKQEVIVKLRSDDSESDTDAEIIRKESNTQLVSQKLENNKDLFDGVSTEYKAESDQQSIEHITRPSSPQRCPENSLSIKQCQSDIERPLSPQENDKHKSGSNNRNIKTKTQRCNEEVERSETVVETCTKEKEIQRMCSNQNSCICSDDREPISGDESLSPKPIRASKRKHRPMRSKKRSQAAERESEKMHLNEGFREDIPTTKLDQTLKNNRLVNDLKLENELHDRDTDNKIFNQPIANSSTLNDRPTGERDRTNISPERLNEYSSWNNINWDPLNNLSLNNCAFTFNDDIAIHCPSPDALEPRQFSAMHNDNSLDLSCRQEYSDTDSGHWTVAQEDVSSNLSSPKYDQSDKNFNSNKPSDEPGCCGCSSKGRGTPNTALSTNEPFLTSPYGQANNATPLQYINQVPYHQDSNNQYFTNTIRQNTSIPYLQQQQHQQHLYNMTMQCMAQQYMTQQMQHVMASQSRNTCIIPNTSHPNDSLLPNATGFIQQAPPAVSGGISNQDYSETKSHSANLSQGQGQQPMSISCGVSNQGQSEAQGHFTRSLLNQGPQSMSHKRGTSSSPQQGHNSVPVNMDRFVNVSKSAEHSGQFTQSVQETTDKIQDRGPETTHATRDIPRVKTAERKKRKQGRNEACKENNGLKSKTSNRRKGKGKVGKDTLDTINDTDTGNEGECDEKHISNNCYTQKRYFYSLLPSQVAKSFTCRHVLFTIVLQVLFFVVFLLVMGRMYGM